MNAQTQTSAGYIALPPVISDNDSFHSIVSSHNGSSASASDSFGTTPFDPALASGTITLTFVWNGGSNNAPPPS